MKKIIISFISGFIAAGLLGLWWWKNNPEIKIVKETKTVTIHDKVPTDYDSCKECADSDIDIIGNINNNIMSVEARDKCKHATKEFTLQSKESRKHFLMFQYTNTAYATSFINHGADISYGYMLWGRLGFVGGIMANNQSITPHVGIIYTW